MSALYTPQMLALTTELARHPLGTHHDRTAQGRSTVCGSALELGLDLDANGNVERIGMRVTACAVGQSAAASMAGSITGRDPSQIHSAVAQIRSWLDGEGRSPEWPRFEVLTAALAHPGRHGALVLPWETAAKALSAMK